MGHVQHGSNLAAHEASSSSHKPRPAKRPSPPRHGRHVSRVRGGLRSPPPPSPSSSSSSSASSSSKSPVRGWRAHSRGDGGRRPLRSRSRRESRRSPSRGGGVRGNNGRHSHDNRRRK